MTLQYALKLLIKLYAGVIIVFGAFLIAFGMYMSFDNYTNGAAINILYLIMLPLGVLHFMVGYMAITNLTLNAVKLLTVLSLLSAIQILTEYFNPIVTPLMPFESTSLTQASSFLLAILVLVIIYLVIVNIIKRLAFDVKHA